MKDRLPTEEFESLKHDPDLQSEPGPGGTLIFLDGNAYCVVGPEFVNLQESDCYAFGDSREQAIANYAARKRDSDYRIQRSGKFTHAPL